jgi:3,4-dihydroxy 2-butanone 4-phosphate synthase/GTP cyclohydrolase II
MQHDERASRQEAAHPAEPTHNQEADLVTDVRRPDGPDDGPIHARPTATGVEAALAELRGGRLVLVVDDEDRENEGDLVMSAENATPEALAFMIRRTSGLICVGSEQSRGEALRLPSMVQDSDDPRGTAFTVSVDLKGASSTGVSAAAASATPAGG